MATNVRGEENVNLSTAARALTEFDPHVVVVDASDGDRSSWAGLVADEPDGERVPLSALSAERVDAAVDAARESQV